MQSERHSWRVHTPDRYPTGPHTAQAFMKMNRVLPLAIAFATPLFAQTSKKVLTQADWDKWKTINAPAISNDGKVSD